MRRTTTLIALFGLTLLAPAHATEDWQLSHGGFTTASDVRPHNGLPQDRADMLDAISRSDPDWAQALLVYTYGANFPWRNMTHSLGRFANNYNGALPSVLPLSVAHFGDPAFAVPPVFAALSGTADYYQTTDDVRTAFVDGATLATILNWTRFELAMSERKAMAAEPNWALTNGSPKNWNEIFAFHFGPEGRHSVHEALAKLEGGERLNAALYATLAIGQEHLLAQRWAETEGAEVARLLHEASLLLFSDALKRADAAPDEGVRAAAVARARGLWLAAAEAILEMAPTDAGLIEDAIAGSGDAAQIGFASEIVETALSETSR